MKCSNCGKAFIAPQAQATPPGDIEALTWLTRIAVIGGAHAVAMLLLAIIVGFGLAATLVFLTVVAEIAVWQREPLARLYREVQRHSANWQATASSKSPSAVARCDPRQDSLDEHGGTRRLVEIQAAAPPPIGSESIPEPKWPSIIASWAATDEPDSSLQANLPQDGISFFGPGTTLDIGRGVLHSPLIYATGIQYQDTFDASLVDGTLPVAAPGAPSVERLPYWPTYFGATPQQRSCYLDWLCSGRRDPDIELGYVFIFFYGLERRIIIDAADHVSVLEELLELYPVYRKSGSFRSYATSLIALTFFLAGPRERIPELLVTRAINTVERWHEDALALCMAACVQWGGILPKELAIVVAERDPRARSSVIVKRQAEKFRDLFFAKYQARFGDGMPLRSSKRPMRITYRPASGSLLQQEHRDKLPLTDMPNVLAVSSQFGPLLEIRDECIDELKGFDRVVRGSGGNTLSTEAFEALPEQIREGDHPELDNWLAIWRECTDEDGWPLAPMSRIAQIKEIPPRERLTKTQCRQILDTADILGIGIEPDARLTERNYCWDERIALFFLEADDRGPGDSTAYIAASILLRLGLHIAMADGHADAMELTLITQHLENQFNLTAAQSKRLERLQYLLLHSPEADNALTTAVCKRLSYTHRVLVGEFLVGIAAADQVVTADEVRALRKAYQVLDLPAVELDKLLRHHATSRAAGDTTAPDSREQFTLDMNTVSRIMLETQEVARILKEAMADDDQPDGGVATASPLESPVSTATFVSAQDVASRPVSTLHSPPLPAAGSADNISSVAELASRFQPFLREVVAKVEWQEDDLRALARRHNVMLGGAIEAINEWSYTTYGDWLIQEGDPIGIHVHLLKRDT